MAETNVKKSARRMAIRHRGRGAQVWIYLGKLLRMFVYQNDWKVLPMAALIAGLVGMVIRKRLFINMEGTLMGAFAMVCVCIWNGCFNSIQVICRERDVIKREHRSGMHISSYIFSHMLYQALLCLLQTGVTLYVTKMVGIQYPEEGLFTRWMIVDYGISMFLITYASDMMSLWISTIAHTTTTAMTIMPFVLIFQLVFSGGMLSLPSWTDYITPFTISNPGLKVLTAQGDYNSRPVVTIWNQVTKMENKPVSQTITLGQVLELMGRRDNPAIADIRGMQLSRVLTVREAWQMIKGTHAFEELRAQNLIDDMTIGDVLRTIDTSEELQELRDIDFGLPAISLGKIVKDILASEALQPQLERRLSTAATVGDVLDRLNVDALIEQYGDGALGANVTVGDIVDAAAASPDVQAHLSDSYTFNTTVGGIIDMIGREKVQDILQNKVRDASYNDDYEYSRDNIANYWISLFLFVLAFAALATISLEFIDKDKR